MKPNFVFKVRLLTNYTDFLQTTYLLTTSQGGNHCIAWEQGRGNDVVVIVKEKKLGKTPHILLCKKEKKKKIKKKDKKNYRTPQRQRKNLSITTEGKERNK